MPLPLPPRQWHPVDQWSVDPCPVLHGLTASDSSATAVIVHLGDHVPWYLYDCLQQLRTFDTPALLVLNSRSVGAWFEKLDRCDVWYFEDENHVVEEIEAQLPAGLFTYSVARFYALHAAMQALHMTECIHLELDNLVYAPGAWLTKHARQMCGSTLGITRDSKRRCIGGWMWIGSVPALSAFLRFMEQEHFAQFEMFLLCDFLVQHPEHATALPVTPASYPFPFPQTPCSVGVFDAAALGQWVGGIDALHSHKDTRGFVNETAAYSPDLLNLAWCFDAQRRRVPVLRYKRQVYRVFNLHMHCKRLWPFMSEPCAAADILQGRKFQALAQKRVLYAHTHEVDELRPLLAEQTEPFVLITHNSDHAINKTHQTLLDDTPLLIRWFAQNVNLEHAKLECLPIGLANSQYGHGNVAVFRQCLQNQAGARPRPAVYSLLAGTHSSRNACKELLRGHNVPLYVGPPDGSRLSPAENWSLSAQHARVACPRGNGIDTHRLWETWYAGILPVMHPGDWLWPFSKLGLPYDLNHQLTSADLYRDTWCRWLYARWHALRFSYWQRCIEQHVTVAPHKRFDVCIVVHPKDYSLVSDVVQAVRRFSFGCRNVYLVTNAEAAAEQAWTSVTIVDERKLEPCSLAFIRDELGFGARAGWYYQQLLKLNVDKLPGCLPKILILDADTVLTDHVTFWDHAGHSLFYLREGEEVYYRNHILRLFPDWHALQWAKHTAVVHHMAFRVDWLQELKTRLARTQPWWRSFLEHVAPADKLKSGASEYELYFQHAAKYHADEIRVRALKHLNTGDMGYLTDAQHPYHLVSFHSYLRKG